MKISELTDKEIRDYLVVDDTEEVSRIKESAVAYVMGYTGLTLDELDKYEEITEAVLCLCNEFYDSRNYGTRFNYENKVIVSILNRYRKGLVC